ncbi:MAG TPA: hypothetical protein DD856_18505 [Sulfobacillus sp.]|nr:hypothetical protein [Sulfobacillus sp.]
MTAILKYEPLAKGPRPSRKISPDVGVSPQHRHFLQSPATMTLFAQWFLTQEFLTQECLDQPQSSVMHQLFGRPEPAYRSIWEQAIAEIAPWFHRILEYRFSDGSRSMVLQNPTDNARALWTSLNQNHQLHPLVTDVFREKNRSVSTPFRPRWISVQGHGIEMVSEWSTFRSFWSAADAEGGIFFTPFGWVFDENFLNQSLFLQSIIASRDEVYLGIGDDNHVRIVFWRIHPEI